MTKKIILGNKKQQPETVSFPQSNIPGIKGSLPISPGRPVIIKKPSPGERAILEEYGWKEGEPVPDNLADIIEQAKREANSLDNIMPPIDPSTPALQIPETVSFESLPKAKQAELRTAMSALQQAKQEYQTEQEVNSAMVPGGNEGINEAIRAAMLPKFDVVDDTRSDTYATGQPKVSYEIKSEVTESKPYVCKHCGWPSQVEDSIVIDDLDKTNFLQALLGLVPFVKRYKLFGGALSVVVRTLTPDELDMCFRQLIHDRNSRKIITPADEMEWLARYRTCLQIVAINGPGVDVKLPETLADWNMVSPADNKNTVLPDIWNAFRQGIDVTETIHRVLVRCVGDHNRVVEKLEARAEDSDFWVPADTQA